MNKWQSIESAPLDGTPILARWRDNVTGIAWYNVKRETDKDPFWWCGIKGWVQLHPAFQPNEWMPLPSQSHRVALEPRGH